jgi:pimeloyl-ACP methyl ester carboxylesterase
MVAVALAIGYLGLMLLVFISKLVLRCFALLARSRRRLPPADRFAAPPSHIAVLVHGTWSRSASWTLPGSALRRAVCETLGNSVMFARLSWSGLNRFASRERARVQLVRRLEELRNDFPLVPILVVGHSHGGNIALGAISSLGERPGPPALVCLSTPFLVAERRELGGMAPLAAWAAPAVVVFFICVGVASEIPKLASGGAEIAVGCASLVISVVLGVAAKALAERSADRILKALDCRIPPAADLLIIRTTADEASAGLNFASLLSEALERVYSFAARPVLDAHETLIEWADALRRRKGWVLGGSAACAAAVLSIKLAIPAPSAAVAVLGLILLAAPGLVFLIWIQGGYGFYLGKFIVLGVMLAPLVVLLGIFAIFLGPELVLSSLFVHISAEASPIGSHTVTMVRSVFANDSGSLAALKHSRSYDAPMALAALKEWLSVNQRKRWGQAI